jgi:hypothetical protein
MKNIPPKDFPIITIEKRDGRLESVGVVLPDSQRANRPLRDEAWKAANALALQIRAQEKCDALGSVLPNVVSRRVRHRR